MKRPSEPQSDLLAIDRDDDAWFEANPHRSYRLRRAHDIEMGSAKRHAGPPASEVSYMVIGLVSGRPVRRILQFPYEMIDSEELARNLYDQFIGAYERPRVYWLLPKPRDPVHDRDDRGDPA